MKKLLCGNEMGKMPDWAFRIMKFIFNIGDIIQSPDKRLDAFQLQRGQTVVDWGCGTGRYLKQASEQVGDNGIVYAVDVHELAVDCAVNMKKKFHLKNVHPVLTDGETVDIPSQSADIIYALDMFHMVRDANGFLKELNRIAKPEGILYIEDGHQSRDQARKKIIQSGYWDVVSETKLSMKCKPIR